MAVRLDQSKLSPFVCPQELLAFEPSEEDAVLPMKGSEGFRLIQNNILLTEIERARIASFRAYQKKMDIKLAPSLQPHIYRYIQMAQNNIPKALQLAVQSQEWRRQTYGEGPLYENELREDLESGFVYFQGRDSSFRPWLIIRVKVLLERKHWTTKRVLSLCFYAWEYAARYLLIPGKVETMNIVVDCAGISLTSIPREKLFEVIGFAGSPAYPGRLHQLFIVNPPAFFSTVFTVIKVFLSEQDRKKLHICKGVDLCKGRSAAHQMEKKYGGSRDDITTFYPYPLPPGPFQADYDGGQEIDAIPYCHRALCSKTTAGVLCETEELRLSPWGPMAPEIFEECDLAWPKHYETIPLGVSILRSTLITQISFDDMDFAPQAQLKPTHSMRLTKVSRLSRISHRITKFSPIASPSHKSRPTSVDLGEAGIGIANVQLGGCFGVDARNEDSTLTPHDEENASAHTSTFESPSRIESVPLGTTSCTPERMETPSVMTAEYSKMPDEDEEEEDAFDNDQMSGKLSRSTSVVGSPMVVGAGQEENEKKDIVLYNRRISIIPRPDEVFEVELECVVETKDQFPNEITRDESTRALRMLKNHSKRIFRCCPGPPRRIREDDALIA